MVKWLAVSYRFSRLSARSPISIKSAVARFMGMIIKPYGSLLYDDSKITRLAVPIRLPVVLARLPHTIVFLYDSLICPDCRFVRLALLSRFRVSRLAPIR